MSNAGTPFPALPHRRLTGYSDLHEVSAIDLGAGQYDYRFVDQGVILEGLEGVTQVGGTADSGCISGGCMDVSRYFESSRVRVHFVEPGTASRTTVARVGAFSTTEDANVNCMEFYGANGHSLGITCMKDPDWSPLTTIEFLGGASCKGIAYVDVFSPNTPFELDLLTFSKREHDGKCGHGRDKHHKKHDHDKSDDHDGKEKDDGKDD